MSSAELINFETLPDGTRIEAPTLFELSSSPLRDEFSAIGVHFEGLGGSVDGGGILNEGGGFGVMARSGSNFLAFNPEGVYKNGSRALAPQVIRFDYDIEDFSAWISGGDTVADFLLEAFQGDELIGSQSVTSQMYAYTRFNFGFSEGFDRVVITPTSEDETFVVDDVSFTAIPGPASVFALCGVGIFGRRRRVQSVRIV